MKNSLLVLFEIFLFGSILAACTGTGQPVPATINPAAMINTPAASASQAPTADPDKFIIPVFSQFVPVPPQQQAALAQPIESQAADPKQGIRAEAKFYTSTAKPEEVADFYKNILKEWKADISPTFEGRTEMRWTKDYQSFLVVYASDDTTPGQFLVMTTQLWK